MPLEKDEVEELELRLSARFAAIIAAHEAHEDHHADGTPKIHTKRIRVRIFAVVLALGSFAGVDHVVHMDWIGRTAEVFIAAFFDYWLNGAAKEGIAPTLPIKRKPK